MRKFLFAGLICGGASTLACFSHAQIPWSQPGTNSGYAQQVQTNYYPQYQGGSNSQNNQNQQGTRQFQGAQQQQYQGGQAPAYGRYPLPQQGTPAVQSGYPIQQQNQFVAPEQPPQNYPQISGPATNSAQQVSMPMQDAVQQAPNAGAQVQPPVPNGGEVYSQPNAAYANPPVQYGSGNCDQGCPGCGLNSNACSHCGMSGGRIGQSFLARRGNASNGINGFEPGCDGNAYGNGANDCGVPKTGLGQRLSQMTRSTGGNMVVGVNSLFFARDYEDDLGLSYNSLNQYLFSTDADNGTFAGFEFMISKRLCNGIGLEARYWGLYPSETEQNFGYTPYTALGGLTQLYYTPNAMNVARIYNRATTHRVYRNNDFQNLELNVLRNGGTYCGLRGKTVHYELLSGFRYFKFDEGFRYTAFNTGAGYPSEFNYDVDVRNSLLGLQLGGRTERCVTERIRLAIGLKGGLFNNHISHNQWMRDSSGTGAWINSGPYTGTTYAFSSTKNDLSMMTEFDMGVIYQVSCNARFNLGYRAIGITGLALGPDQVPYNFTDINDIQRIDSNGSMLLHGVYGGFQFCH